MKRVLLVDNYDSFTYNLAQYFGELGCDVVVRRNDAVTIAQAEEIAPTHVVISPGPGHPKDARASLDLIRHFAGKLPVLGVCLGHQAIGLLHGASIARAGRTMHGKTSLIRHDGRSVFRSLPNPLRATRYHSLVVREEGLPSALEVSARSGEGEIMGLRVKGSTLEGLALSGRPPAPVEGVQFHPESILSQSGRDLLRNFLDP